MKHQAILFDVDGTLLDTREFIFQAFEHAFQSHGLTHLSRQDVHTVTGRPLEECYETLAPDENAQQLCQIHRRFQEENMSLIKPFPNTKDTIVTLQEAGLRLGIISTRKQTTIESLERSGVLNHFDVIVTGDDVQQFKPHPEGVLKALRKLSATPKQAAMVGDTAADIEAGKNAGTATVAAAYGFAPAKELAQTNPDFIIEDIAELISVLTTPHQ